MINKDRIVSITATDLITLYSVILAVALAIDSDTITKLEHSDVEGDFTASSNGIYMADQPVKHLNFTSGATVYFVADYKFEGFSIVGEDATLAEGSDEIIPDACTLYKAVAGAGEVTVNKIGL